MQVEEEISLEEDDMFEEFEDQVIDGVGKEKLWQVHEPLVHSTLHAVLCPEPC